MDEIQSNSFTESALTPDHIRAIGLIASEWGYVELLIERYIWRLSKIPKNTGYSITTHLGSVTRIEILKTLVDVSVLDKSIKNEILSIAKKFDDLRIKRNNIIHAIWLNGESEGARSAKAVTVKARGKLTIEHTHYAQETINETALAITDLAVVMLDLIPKLPEEVQQTNALLSQLLLSADRSHGPTEG